MIGPTGCGKTEIARRLAKIAYAPFVKVILTINPIYLKHFRSWFPACLSSVSWCIAQLVYEIFWHGITRAVVYVTLNYLSVAYFLGQHSDDLINARCFTALPLIAFYVVPNISCSCFECRSEWYIAIFPGGGDKIHRSWISWPGCGPNYTRFSWQCHLLATTEGVCYFGFQGQQGRLFQLIFWHLSTFWFPSKTPLYSCVRVRYLVDHL